MFCLAFFLDLDRISGWGLSPSSGTLDTRMTRQSPVSDTRKFGEQSPAQRHVIPPSLDDSFDSLPLPPPPLFLPSPVYDFPLTLNSPLLPPPPPDFSDDVGRSGVGQSSQGTLSAVGQSTQVTGKPINQPLSSQLNEALLRRRDQTKADSSFTDVQANSLPVHVSLPTDYARQQPSPVRGVNGANASSGGGGETGGKLSDRWRSMDDVNNNIYSSQDYLTLAKDALSNFKAMTSSMSDLTNIDHRQSSTHFPPPPPRARNSGFSSLPPPPCEIPPPPPPPMPSLALSYQRTKVGGAAQEVGGAARGTGEGGEGKKAGPQGQGAGGNMFNLAQYAAEKALARQRKMQEQTDTAL